MIVKPFQSNFKLCLFRTDFFKQRPHNAQLSTLKCFYVYCLGLLDARMIFVIDLSYRADNAGQLWPKYHPKCADWVDRLKTCRILPTPTWAPSSTNWSIACWCQTDDRIRSSKEDGGFVWRRMGGQDHSRGRGRLIMGTGGVKSNVTRRWNKGKKGREFCSVQKRINKK